MKNKKLIAYYITNQPITLREMGEYFKVSKQRISQILLGNGIHPLKVRISKYQQCKMCGRKFGKLKHAGHSLCTACTKFRDKSPKRIRTISYTEKCKKCNKPIPKGTRRALSMCANCYASYAYHRRTCKKKNNRVS